MHKNRRGVTLFESIVVMAILVMAAAGVVLTVGSVSGNTPLNAAADTVKARWADARSRAVSEGRPYRFSVMQGTGKFRVAPDGSDFWDGGASGSTSTASGDGSQPLIIEGKLPANILFRGAQSTDPSQTNGQQSTQGGGQSTQGGGNSGDWSCPIVFMPDGTTQQDAEVVFGGPGTRTITLKVRSSTGAVTTSP